MAARGSNHGLRHASDRRDLQAERAIGGAGLDVVQEHQAFALRVVVLGGVEVDVGDAWQCVGECRQFEVMGCERSEEHTSELQSLMRISYAVFCLKKKHLNIMT